MARLARTRMSHLFCTHFRCTRNKTLPFASAMSDDEKRERAMRDRYTRGKDFVARRGLLRTERHTQENYKTEQCFRKTSLPSENWENRHRGKSCSAFCEILREGVRGGGAAKSTQKERRGFVSSSCDWSARLCESMRNRELGLIDVMRRNLKWIVFREFRFSNFSPRFCRFPPFFLIWRPPLPCTFATSCTSLTWQCLKSQGRAPLSTTHCVPNETPDDVIHVS